MTGVIARMSAGFLLGSMLIIINVVVAFVCVVSVVKLSWGVE